MALIALDKPVFIRGATFTVATDDFSAHLNNVTLTPSTTMANHIGIDGSVHTFSGPTIWTLDAGYIQDEGDDSMSSWVWDTASANDNTAEVVLIPTDGGRTYTMTIRVVHGSIGGASGQMGNSTVSFGVIGQPVRGALV